MRYIDCELIIPVVSTAVVTTFFEATASATTEVLLFEAATASALLFRLRFVDDNLTTHHFRVVQTCDSLLSFTIIFHFNKAKTFAAARNFVFDDLCRSNC